MDITAIIIRFINTRTHAQTDRHTEKKQYLNVNKRETCLQCPCRNFVILYNKHTFNCPWF